MNRRRTTIVAASVTCLLLLAACSGDGDATPPTSAPDTSDAPISTDAPVETAATPPPDTQPVTESSAPDGPWTVNTDDCADPAAADTPITGTVQIGSVMPLSGGVAAATFAPVKDGFEAYIAHAREQGLFAGYDDIGLTIEDDQYDPNLTPGAVAKQVAAGADLFAGIIGSKNNEVVRDELNAACIPQLNALSGSPAWGDVVRYPWTTGVLVPDTVETLVDATSMAQMYPAGATVGLFVVDNEFGQQYADQLNAVADAYGLTVTASQTVSANDLEAPTAQVTALADAAPDVVFAVPLGAGCLSFFGELASAKALHPDWKPAVFVTNACASIRILAAAGPAADGLYTTSNLLDIDSPAAQANPVVADYVAYMVARGTGQDLTTAAAGWTTGEITVAIVNQAAASPDGLTRASIIEAARNFEFTPSLARAGVVDRSMGTADPYLAQSLQVVQFDAETASFSDVGAVVTAFETPTTP